MNSIVILGTLFLSTQIQSTRSYRFLGIFPLPIKSHYYVFEKVMKLLVDRGHEVDVLSHFPQEDKILGYNDLSVAGSLPIIQNNFSVEDLLNRYSFDTASYMFRELGTNVCEHLFAHAQTQDLRNSKQVYDVVIVELYGTDCFLGFGHLFKAPIIGISSTMELPWGLDRTGNPDNPAYMSNFLARGNGITLMEKIDRTFAAFQAKCGYFMLSTVPSDVIAKKFFGSDWVSLDYLASSTSLLLVNSHFTINGARPNVPAFVEIGGIHLKKPQQLPQNLLSFVNSADHGVIYFSMGTTVRLSSFHPMKIKSILKAFENLPQKVLVKGFPDDFKYPLPVNVFSAPWLPQFDILCHPKTRLFISHCGQLSMLEAVHCGVPVLGVPFQNDQYINIRNYQDSNAGKLLDYEDITEEAIISNVKSLLSNTTYRKSARYMSTIFKDRPISTSDLAIYWIEYVARYKGAQKLRVKGADLNLFEYYIADVAVVVGLVGFVAFLVLVFVYHRINVWYQAKIHVKTKPE